MTQMAALPPTRSKKPLVVIVVGLIAVGLAMWQVSDGGSASSQKRGAKGVRVAAGPSAPLVFRDGKWQRPVPGRRLPKQTLPPADGLVRVSGAVVDASSGKPV